MSLIEGLETPRPDPFKDPDVESIKLLVNKLVTD